LHIASKNSKTALDLNYFEKYENPIVLWTQIQGLINLFLLNKWCVHLKLIVTLSFIWSLVNALKLGKRIRLNWWNVMKWSGAEYSGVEWDGAERNKYSVPLFEYFKKERNKIDGKWSYYIKFIPFYFIPLNSIIIFQI
jgi:hypothetical protein